jgi:hypothetical protein
MGFKIDIERTFTRRILVQVPVDGGFKEESLKATYRALPPDRIEEFDLATAEGGDEFLRAVIVELDELLDASGTPLAYNDEVRDQVIRIPYARLPLVKGYFDAVSRARKGN